MTKATNMQCYLFDLRGYLVIENALSATEVTDCNAIINDLKDR